MGHFLLEDTKYVLYDKKKRKVLDINTSPIFEDYGIVFNLAGQVLLTCEGQIIGYLGDRYEIRKKRRKKVLSQNNTQKSKSLQK